MQQQASPPSPSVVVAGYVRRSSEMQKDNYSIDAQKRAIKDACRLRGLPEPIFYEDDERSARGEQIAKRPAFKQLLDDVQAGRVHIIVVHTLDRWSRNVMVTLQSFRILSEHHTAFISLSEHIDYSTPEGRLQLTILAAFAAYFSDMLAKHTSKGKGERAAQGLYNGDVPFGYRWTGPKLPPEFDPDEFPGLRLIGELRMQGKTAEDIADAVNAAGYRTGSKRFGARMNYKAPQRSEQAHRIYEFSGYIVCAHCGLNLRCRGAHQGIAYAYYKDMAKARQYDCPAGGYLQVRTDLVTAQFGDLLQGLRLPPYWREIIREKMLEAARQTGVDTESIEREKERLKLKRGRILKQHREGYIDDEEFEGEMAAVELALHALEVPELDGISLDDVIAAGERLPGMAALWSVATVEERRDMVMLIVKPGGLHYDVEMKEIAAITPRPVFLPVLRLLEGVVEYEEATGTLVTGRWQQRNRRDSNPRSPA